jgi:hypothetical protein
MNKRKNKTDEGNCEVSAVFERNAMKETVA